MEITVTQEQARVPVTVFHVTGDVNVTTFEALQKQAREAHEAGMQNMVLDLAGVNYISSAGIRAITAIFRFLRGTAPEESPAAMQKGIADGTFKSPHLKLAGPTRNVMEVLKLSGADMFLEVHPDVKAALAAF